MGDLIQDTDLWTESRTRDRATKRYFTYLTTIFIHKYYLSSDSS